MRLFYLSYLVPILLTVSAPLLAETQNEKLQAPLFNNLGSFHYPISTKIPAAQKFFDQGLTLYYGFEWSESIRSFKEATRLDPNCGICYWGLALALGSKINAPMTGHEYQDAKDAIQHALALSSHETPREQDYIKALSVRYEHAPKAGGKSGTFSCHTVSTSDDESSSKERIDYANAMKKVVAKYPDDENAKVLYAAALYWSMSGTNPTASNPAAITAIKTIESVFKKNELNVGANHYYIHLTEPYAHPERATASADRLRTLVPGSEHLVHMPTHIYFLTGRYHEGTEANQRAIKAYQNYNETCLAQGFKPEVNYLYFHNFDFLRTIASMEGRKAVAMQAAQQLISSPFPEWLAQEASLQWFTPIPYYVEARFGLWADLLKQAKPQDQYQYALGMWHYAHGMALAHTGDVSGAKNDAMALAKIIAKGPADQNLQKNGIKLLTIAQAILTATLDDLRGDEKSTLAHLMAAMKIQQDMGYHEPPDWYFPVKEVLGNAYLKWHHPEQAVAMYEQDLQQYPKNGWALYGLAKSLKALGKNKEAERIEAEFKTAWKYADVPAPVLLFPLN